MKIKIYTPNPSFIFIITTLVFQTLPSFYIYSYQIYSPRALALSYYEYFSAAEKMMFASMYIFILTSLLLMINKYLFKKKSYRSLSSKNLEAYISEPKVRILSLMLLIVSTLFVILYGLNGGFYKLSLLGSDLGSRDFRFLNFNEVPRVFTYLLQMARRIILPALIFALYFLHRKGIRNLIPFIVYAISLDVLASALTFARAPFLMLLVSMFLAYYLTEKKTYKKIFSATFGIFSVIIISGLTTKLQYNILEFDFFDIIGTGTDFLVNRAWLVPAIVPINLSFSQFDGFSDSLFLFGSRLFGMLTGNVIGTLQDDSIIVAPVGFIGDIWRNFGLTGIITSPFIFAAFFIWLDFRHKRIKPLRRLVGSYLIIGLVFYWIMGVVFSAGAILILLIVIIMFKPKIRLNKSI